MSRKQAKNLQKQESSGRSMVEMLGVLAVIGVLSIGGILGYRYAMDYYQADQIANEMNMMRTDAKFKLSTGAAQALHLGSPYDDTHTINFNAYDTDYDCLDWVEGEDPIDAPTIACNEAGAYFIEVQNVSAGVCKPLSTLLSGMDEKILLAVNDEAFTSPDLCDSEENDLTVYFALEEVINNGTVDDDTDDTGDKGECETDDDCAISTATPICHTSKHVCVTCMQDSDCTKAGYPLCDKITNICVSCPYNTKWDEDLKKCVGSCGDIGECGDDEYCAELEDVCEWSGWVDNHNHRRDDMAQTDGDWESPEDVCPTTKTQYYTDIQCRSAMFPSLPLDQLGQTLKCNLIDGLVCYNKDQVTGGRPYPAPYCMNYEINVMCCKKDYACVKIKTE